MRRLLGALPLPIDERILVGFKDADDAAVYRIAPDRALVLTTDVITPLVDDAERFGAIAAQNALSDVHAMGGTPMVSLSFYSAPRDFPVELGAGILKGAAETALAAGAPVLGGHSVEGRDLMMGLMVVGQVHPDRLLENRRARAGEQLVLTKPLGTGALTTGRKRDLIDEAALEPAILGMLRSNGPAAQVLLAHGVRAATDVSGFGLLGHAAEVAKASGARLVLRPEALPAYPGALELLERGVTTRANPRNLEYARDLGPLVGTPSPLMLDPQTSGGLLAAVPAQELDAVLRELRAAGCVEAAHIGEVQAGSGIALTEPGVTST